MSCSVNHHCITVAFISSHFWSNINVFLGWSKPQKVWTKVSTKGCGQNK